MMYRMMHYISGPQIARELNVSTTTVNRWRLEGVIEPAVKIGEAANAVYGYEPSIVDELRVKFAAVAS